MMCQRCDIIGLNKVYQCLDCYEDEQEDSIMCLACKKEHLEANIGNKTRFKTITHWSQYPEGQ